jgi:hypothetical protein
MTICAQESSRYHFFPNSPGKICHRESSSSSTMWLSEWDRILMRRSFRVGRPIGYFCPDGACAFALLEAALLAS